MENDNKIIKKLVEHDEHFGRIEKKLSEHDDRFSRIENKLTDHDDRFEKLSGKLDIFRQEYLSGQEKMMTILKRLAPLESSTRSLNK